MHEYGLTRQIVRVVNDAALEHGASGVETVYLVVGENTSIIPQSVQMYYDQIAKGTLSQGAKIITRVIKSQMHCPKCEKNFLRPRFSFACPDCGTLGRMTDIGNEFYVESVEMDFLDNETEEP